MVHLVMLDLAKYRQPDNESGKWRLPDAPQIVAVLCKLDNATRDCRHPTGAQQPNRGHLSAC
jgi:hypothetical protein